MTSIPTIPHAIKKDEKLTATTNGLGIPLVMSLHLWVSSPWIPATIAAVAMNLTYIEASIRALLSHKKDDGDASSKNYLQTEVPVSLVMIGMALYGYAFDVPIWIISSIFIHAGWDMAKHTCGAGVPFFGWYLSGCAVFDVIYSAILLFYVLPQKAS